MRNLWIFIGGVVAAILAVTEVFAMAEEKSSPAEHDEDASQPQHGEIEEKNDDDAELVVQPS